MKKAKQFNIICHYPKTEEEINILQRTVSSIQSEMIIGRIKEMTISNDSKQKIIDKIITSIQ